MADAPKTLRHTLPYPTLRAAAAALAAGETTSVALVQAIAAARADVDGTVNAYRSFDVDGALALAAESDARRTAGSPLSPWDGLPIAVKDNINVTGQPNGCSSKILEGYTAAYDASVIARLRHAGAIPCGRTNMDEFAMGSSTEHSAYGPTRNPRHTDHVPGGSSGGSAAVVAAGEAFAALGSDTGGSIRQPASYCGVVGLKPTYGRVSRFGLTAFASSLDQIGPLTADVADAALLLDLIGGHDRHDSTSLPDDLAAAPAGGFLGALEGADVRGLRVGVAREHLQVEGLDPEVRASIDATLDRLRAGGATIVDVSLPNTTAAVATYYVIATAEASSNLSRFDGVRYGARAKDAENLMQVYTHTREQGFGGEVKRRIILGTFVLSSGYHDAYYSRAQKVRTLIRRDFDTAFASCDVLLTPVAPTPAFAIGAVKDPLEMYLADIYTIPVNLAGNCAISIPAGTSAAGLPIGIQLIGPSLAESTILRTAKWLEECREAARG